MLPFFFGATHSTLCVRTGGLRFPVTKYHPQLSQVSTYLQMLARPVLTGGMFYAVQRSVIFWLFASQIKRVAKVLIFPHRTFHTTAFSIRKQALSSIEYAKRLNFSTKRKMLETYQELDALSANALYASESEALSQVFEKTQYFKSRYGLHLFSS